MDKLRWEINNGKVLFNTYLLVIINFLIAGIWIYDLSIKEKNYAINEIPTKELILILLYLFLGFLFIYISQKKQKELNKIKTKWPGENGNEIAIPIAEIWSVNLNKRSSQVRTTKGYYEIPPEATLINLEVLKKKLGSTQKKRRRPSL